MRGIGRRVALVVAAMVAAVGFTAVSAPAAQALDSGWGCGGACKARP